MAFGTAVLAQPAPKLPSLVEAARASEWSRWRAFELKKERAGKSMKPAGGYRLAKKCLAVRSQVHALRAEGLSFNRIALRLGVSRATVREASLLQGASSR